MSAPNPGRQSPEPETQTGNQLKNPPASNHKHGAAPGEKAADHSKDQLSGLESNPKGALEESAKEKVAKS